MTETLFSENPDCRLTLTVTTDAGPLLRLQCRVANTGSTVLYLCDQLYNLPQPYSTTAEPVFDLSPDLVHIQVDAEGVHIDKAIMDLSFRPGIRGLDIPFLTRLQPGQEHTQLVQLSLPLLPYKVQGLHPAEAPPMLLPLRFSLGYFVGSAEVEANLTESATMQGPALCIAPFLSRYQQIITVGPFQQQVPVANAVGNTTSQPVSAENWTPWG